MTTEEEKIPLADATC
jgi:hypothetical protein